MSPSSQLQMCRERAVGERKVSMGEGVKQGECQATHILLAISRTKRETEQCQLVVVHPASSFSSIAAGLASFLIARPGREMGGGSALPVGAHYVMDDAACSPAMTAALSKVHRIPGRGQSIHSQQQRASSQQRTAAGETTSSPSHRRTLCVECEV